MQQMIESIGWIGALLLGLCALPQVIMCVKTKTAQGVSWGFLLMWFLGEVFTLWYIFAKEIPSFPLIANYSINILGLLVIFKYKFNDLKRW